MFFKMWLLPPVYLIYQYILMVRLTLLEPELHKGVTHPEAFSTLVTVSKIALIVILATLYIMKEY